VSKNDMCYVSYIYVEDLHSNFFCLTPDYKLFYNDLVVIDTLNGIYIGNVSVPSKTILKKGLPKEMPLILRLATEDDLVIYYNNIDDSYDALLFAQKESDKLKLNMHFINSFYNFDRSQLLLSYEAESRVDFRELAKRLAKEFKTRIELRQIAVRDRAKIVGGIGPCGLMLCCNKFLNDFSSVSINMAKNQNLVLTPGKLNGVCNRLLCCLGFEDAIYSEINSKLPKIGKEIETESGVGKVSTIDVLRENYTVEYPSGVKKIFKIED